MIIFLLFMQLQTPEGIIPQYLKKDIPLPGFNARDVSIAELFHQISKEQRVNIVVDTQLQEKVNIQLHQTSLNELLHYFVSAYGLECRVIGGIIHLTLPEPEEVPIVNEIQWDAAKNSLAFDLTDLSLREFARQLTEKTGKNVIVPEKSIKGKLTGFQGALPFDKALTVFMQSNGFDVLIEDEVYQLINQTRTSVAQTATKEPSETQKKSSEVKQVSSVTETKLQPNDPVMVKNGLVSLHVKQMPIMEIFEKLSTISDINFCIYGELKEQITIDVVDLTHTELLDLLLNNTEYTYVIDKGMYLIGEKTASMFLSSELVPFKHMNAEMMQKILPASITEGITVTMVKEHNSLLLTGPKNKVQQVKTLAESMDLNIPQVLIEVLVVDFSTNDDRDIGVKITNGENEYFPELDLTLDGFRGEDGGFSIRRLPSNFSLRIKAMETNGRAKVISKPHIAALNGHEAEIVIGTKQFYLLKSEELVGNENPRVRTTERVEEIEANINLKITPWVSSHGEVTTVIEPSFTTFLGSVTGSVPPPISTRQLKSTVRLKDGETIILGGLIENFTTRDLAGVPFISRIPLLGSLFRNTKTNNRNSELVIYLTPHVYYGDEGSVEFIKEEEGLEYQLDISKQKEGIKADYPKKKSWWKRMKERRAKKKKKVTTPNDLP